MAIRKEMDSYLCGDCIRSKNWGKRNCKKCSYYYTKEHNNGGEQIRREYRRKKREARKNSPPELVDMYNFIRTQIFPEGYLPDPKRMTFRWGKKGSVVSRCWTWRKEIAIAPTYKGYDNGLNLGLIMIHEALHLRLPHHRKSFKIREKLYKNKLREILEKEPMESVQNPPEMQYNNIVEIKEDDNNG